MMAQWWSQTRAVIRLEMRKTFFAKRGLWVYLLALAPVALFLAHSIDMMRDRDRRQALNAAHPVSSEALRSVEHGITPSELVAKLGEPYSKSTFRRRSRERATYRYTDGQNDVAFTFVQDELVSIHRQDLPNLSQDSVVFATVFQFFFLRLAIFFGCVGIFMNLFRGELVDKSLHFYLLAPIRREVLLAGKYLAGLIATVVIFTASTALQIWALLLQFDSRVVDEYLRGAGWGHIGAYLGVTALACLGYGSVFLAAGLMFRNPIIPAASVLLWESANLFLPAALKKISVIFYLQSLCPVVAPPDINMAPGWALLISAAEPTPAVWAVTGLVVVTLAVLVMASLKARKLEINYGTD